MDSFSWGQEPTQFFFQLTPERVLEAVESTGLRCTGRCQALNSMENRVYDVELEATETTRDQHSSVNHRVVKFYRPGRWSEAQIREEHDFLLELTAEEIPAVAPLRFPDGDTLKKEPESEIWYALFPRMGGRVPDELSDEQLQRIGRLIARVHNVGAAKENNSRLQLNTETYGEANLRFLLEKQLVPMQLEKRFQAAVDAICAISAPWFAVTPRQRIHGDCHLGNFLWGPEGPILLDFDDMVEGPTVQDLWLLVPGRDERAQAQWATLLGGYQEMRDFNHASLRLVEPLRALRFVHFAAWIGKRWEDPAFQNVFTHYGTFRYWDDLTNDLEEQLRLTEQAEAR